MDSYNLSEDINVYCVTATHFPDGIERAHIQLRAMLPEKENRHFFGISWRNEKGEIIYKAAADHIEQREVEKLGLEPFTIRKGDYNCFFIKDFLQNIDAIPQSFDILLKQQEVDPNGYCLEWYIGDNDVRCMVPVDNHLHFTGLNRE